MEKQEASDLTMLHTRDISKGKQCWNIDKDEKYGRYMVAVRDIAPGEIILTEEPLMWGPNPTNPVLVCVGCYRHINEDQRVPGCSRCQLPVCSENCQNNEKHEHMECKLFEKFRHSFNFRNEAGDYDIDKVPYTVILIVRLLLMKEKSPENWKIFNHLESLLDEWKSMGSWENDQEETVCIIRDKLGMKSFGQEEILKVIAVCCTNTFSKFLEPDAEVAADSEHVAVGTKIRLLYPLSAMMSHSCCPNAEQSIHALSDNLLFVLRASRQINCGEQIMISYTELLSNTINRQFNLLTSKLFVCQCRRCIDPTDLGSYSSALKCTICMKKSPASVGSILSCPANTDQWQCNKCKSKFTTVNIQNLVFKIHDELDKVIESPVVGVEDVEKFLKKYSKFLHPHNGILTRAKYNLCGQYGRMPGYTLMEMTPTQLQRKKELCTEMMEVLDLLQPGRTSRRGLILYELHMALLLLGKMNLQSDQGAKKDLKKSLSCLKESLDILKDEPRNTFGGQLYLGATASAADVEVFIKSLLK